MKIFFALTYFFLIFSMPCWAESIVLKSGKTIDAKILEKNTQEIKVDFKGVTLTYGLDEVSNINGEAVSSTDKSNSATPATIPPTVFSQDSFSSPTAPTQSAPVVETQGQTNDILTRAGNVSDNRSLDGQFTGLKFEILLLGDILYKAEGVKLSVTRAVDDTGYDLIKKDDFFSATEFQNVDSNKAGQVKVEANLKNPPRKASLIKELQGEVEVYCSTLDPAAVFKLEQFMQKLGQPIEIKEQQVTLTLYDKNKYEEMKKESQSTPPPSTPPQSATTDSKKQIEDYSSKEMANAFGKIFMNMFGMGNMDEKSIAVRLQDPDSKVVEVRFFSANGQPIKNNGWFGSNEGPDRMKTYSFDKIMPSDAYLVVYLKTDKALKKVAINMKDIPLP